jgi:hypothetical protein
MKYALIAAVWLVVALAAGASGALQQLRPPIPQLILAGLTIAVLAAWRISGAFRAWLEAIDLRWLIALHLTRFVGLYFLFLCGRGDLPCTFARPAGWGDVVVAILACVLLLGWRKLGSRSVVVGLWNVLGLIDILLVVTNAARHGVADPPSMAALLRLPLSLLPTFLVPLIIASHVVIFNRLVRDAPSGRLSP